MGCLSALKTFTTTVRQYCTKPVMKYLNVAEKNDAAKNIAQILSRGGSTRREGYSKFNKIYEFDTTVFNQNARMAMTSVSGHLLNYEFVATFRGWTSCNPVALFDAPIIKTCPKDYENIKRTLQSEIRSCQGLIIWTDCDREGENIGFEIIKVCTDIKPDLRIYRAKFSEITGASIFRAINSLGQPNKNVSDAVDVRQELDLRTGAAFTRLQTLRLQKVFPQKLADKLISYGSCQFPTLGFVVDRYQAIEDFIPEPFWKIKMSHTVKELTTDFLWNRERLFDKDACEAILDVCKENPQATVEKVESKPKSKWRPVPLDTVEMEKNVSRKLKINAKETMKIAEKLYSQGFISYPRTETNIFPKELNLTNLVEQQREDQRWGPFANRIMNEGGPTPRQGKKSDQAHPPIHPIKYTNSLGGNDQRVYEYIVRHFLACVHKDAEGFETVVTADIAGEKFTAKGLIVLEKNYLDVYIYEKWNAKEINNYQRGDTFMPTVLDLTESSTNPPKLLTEADLIALMDKHGIGTDATHAEHIDKIKSREYVGLHENMYFVPGTLGMGLVEGYNNIGLEVSLAKPVLRAEFERDLKLICDGLKDPEVVRQEQIQKYKALFETVVEKMRQIDDSLANRLEDRPQAVAPQDYGGNIDHRPVLKCPKCGQDMILKDKKNGTGKFICCTGFPECKNAVWLPALDSVEVMEESCRLCGPNVKKLKMKFRQNLFPGEPNPNVYCIGGCDRHVLESLDIHPSTVCRIGPAAAQRPATANHTNLNNTNLNNTRNYTPPAPRINNTTNAAPRNNTANNAQTNRPFNNNTTFNDSRTNNTIMMPRPGPSTAGSDEAIVCQCNVDAIQLTVRKDGPNQGRLFYKCGSGTCNFFLWAPDGSDGSSNQTRTFDQGQTNNSTALKCSCGLPPTQKTVAKAGPNTGRLFYCCPKPMGQGCQFFKWVDEHDGNGGGGGNDSDDDRRGGGGGGGGGMGRGNANWKGKTATTSQAKQNRTAPYNNNKPRAKRKCSRCGEEGHNKNKCPS